MHTKIWSNPTFSVVKNFGVPSFGVPAKQISPRKNRFRYRKLKTSLVSGAFQKT